MKYLYRIKHLLVFAGIASAAVTTKLYRPWPTQIIHLTTKTCVGHALETNLSNAKMHNTKCTGATFSKASLNGADLYGIDFEGTDLNGADFSLAKNIELSMQKILIVHAMQAKPSASAKK